MELGQQISKNVVDIFSVLKIPVEFEIHQIHTKGQTQDGDLISLQSIEAIRKHKYGLKGPFETPIGKGFRSLNVTLRKKLNLYANVRLVDQLKVLILLIRMQIQLQFDKTHKDSMVIFNIKFHLEQCRIQKPFLKMLVKILLNMQLANDPSEFEVMVMPNLYEDIVSDLCAGLMGGLGLTASGNIGHECQVYQAVHGTAPDIVGKNLANPTA